MRVQVSLEDCDVNDSPQAQCCLIFIFKLLAATAVIICKMTKPDAYVQLGLAAEGDLSALTLGDIRRAYRTRALQLHPDKNRDDPNAAARFAALFVAYETLLDADKRAKIDGARAARAARAIERSRLDAKRRHLRDELEAEEAAPAPKMDGAALARMQEELRRLREETFTPGRSSARAAGVPSSAWSCVPGFVEFVNAKVPFEEFEKDVLDEIASIR